MATFSMSLQMVPTLPAVMRSLGLTSQQLRQKDLRTLQKFTAFSIREMQRALTINGQGQPGGEQWEELTSDWADYKDFMGWSPLIGVATGAMRKTVGGEVNRSKMESVTGIGGESSEYAEYFNDKREILPEVDYAADKLMNIYLDELRIR